MGESPNANLIEVKAREAQGRCREAGSEGSVEQRRELTYRNQIRGRFGQASQQMMTKPISIKAHSCTSGSCAPKVYCLTPGDLVFCWAFPTGRTARFAIEDKKSAEAIVGASRRAEQLGVVSRTLIL